MCRLEVFNLMRSPAALIDDYSAKPRRLGCLLRDAAAGMMSTGSPRFYHHLSSTLYLLAHTPLPLAYTPIILAEGVALPICTCLALLLLHPDLTCAMPSV
eukprot:scaffold60601_cov32-Tisochrysis_lutea.AAC.1